MSRSRSSRSGGGSGTTRGGFIAKKKAAGQARGFIVFILVVALTVVVCGRLGYLQVVKANEYSSKAQEQRKRDITLTPRRGTIYDRRGEVLASSISATTIYANPKQVKDKADTAAKMASVLGGSVSDYERKLSKKTGFVYIQRQVDPDTAHKLESYELAGVFFLDDSKRSYPNGQIAGQLLGFVDPDGNGKSGLELYYDEMLKGKAGELLVERGKDGTPIPGGVIKEEPSTEGKDIMLSIDKNIQQVAESELATSVAQWGAKGGTVIVMNPKNGEIFAMASTPFANPNKPQENAPDAMKNKAVTDAYEPGSTIKSMTLAAALDKGVVTPSQVFSVPSVRKVYDQEIHDAFSHTSSQFTVHDIITKSSNIGTSMIADKLGKQSLYDYFASFGLTQKPGVDFPGSTKGSLPPTRNWSGTTYANVSFGQGLSVSALQLARGVSGIANGGQIPTPHFLIDTPGTEYIGDWPVRYAVSAKAAAETNSVLIDAATSSLKSANSVPGYTVAGKTGTAQKAHEGALGYAEGSYTSSFVGYLPAEDPELLIYVVLDEPKKAYYGSMVATGAFKKIAAYSAAELDLPTSKRINDQKKAQEDAQHNGTKTP